MVTALFPGSFDPPTNGHLDLITRAAKIFDRVVVAVGFNDAKQGWMPVAERVDLLKQIMVQDPGLVNVTVGEFQGLTTDFAIEVGAQVLVKGARSASDWEWEYTQATVNSRLSDLDTLILPTNPQWATLSSSIVRELANYEADLEGLVPEPVLRAISKRP